jgi:hypothetical protein
MVIFVCDQYAGNISGHTTGRRCTAEMRKGRQIRRAGSDLTTNALPSDNLRNTEHATCIISTKTVLAKAA